MPEVDLRQTSRRELNATLHALAADTNETHWVIRHPDGQHAIACGLDLPIGVEIEGNVGYYCAGMNKQAHVVIRGNAGVGVAENMMSGIVHVAGNASQSAGATAHGGLLVVDGDAGARCGIAMKGVDIVVKGSIGHMSAFMAQAGSPHRPRRCRRGARRFALRGQALRARRGDEPRRRLHREADARRAPRRCLSTRSSKAAGLNGEIDIAEFRRYGSARKLYHFHVDNAGAY